MSSAGGAMQTSLPPLQALWGNPSSKRCSSGNLLSIVSEGSSPLHAANGGAFSMAIQTEARGNRIGVASAQGKTYAAVVMFTPIRDTSWYGQTLQLRVRIFFERNSSGITLGVTHDTVFRKSTTFLSSEDYVPICDPITLTWGNSYSGWQEAIFTVPRSAVCTNSSIVFYDVAMRQRNTNYPGGMFITDVRVMGSQQDTPLVTESGTAHPYRNILTAAMCTPDSNGPADYWYVPPSLCIALLSSYVGDTYAELPRTGGYERVALPTRAHSIEDGVLLPEIALPTPTAKWLEANFIAIYNSLVDGSPMVLAKLDIPLVLYPNDVCTLSEQSLFKVTGLEDELADGVYDLFWTRDREWLSQYFIGADSATREYKVRLYKANGSELGPFSNPLPTATFEMDLAAPYGMVAWNVAAIRFGVVTEEQEAPVKVGLEYGHVRFTIPLTKTSICPVESEFYIQPHALRLQFGGNHAWDS